MRKCTKSRIFDQFTDLHQAIVRDEGREGKKKEREIVRVLRTEEEARIGN